MKKEVDIVIIGAGASGLMLGALLENKNILIVDNNAKIGSKILVSGGGKCNVTNGNINSKNYLGNQRFIRNVLKRFDQHALLFWLAERGLTPIVRKNHQYFCENSSKELIDLLGREISRKDIVLNVTVEKVEQKESVFEILTSRGKIKAKQVVVATGGLSFPKIGATDIGYKIAKSFGHEISTLSAGLVGFTVQPEQFFFKELSGASLEVRITTEQKSFVGDILFTHKGISSPAVLNASLYWKKGQIEIDFLPDFDLSHMRGKKQISTILPLPKKVAKAFLEHLKIIDKPAERLTAEEKADLKRLQHYRFAPAGTFGYSKAEVTRGGVRTSEIDPYSMMSLLKPNLYFVGEVLAVTGELGGYNFQWAFSSAYCCAEAIKGEGDV